MRRLIDLAITIGLMATLLAACQTPTATTPKSRVPPRPTATESKLGGTEIAKEDPIGVAAVLGSPVPGPTGVPHLPVLPVTPVVANNGASVIANNGASLSGKVKSPAELISDHGVGIISNNSAGIISNNGSGYKLLAALAQVPYANASVALVDAAGRPLTGADGQPLVTRTGPDGSYAFTAPLPAHNVRVVVTLPGASGRLEAIAPPAATPDGRRATVDVDFVSTLTTAYIQQQYVARQTDPVATLERLPAAVEADTRSKAEAAFALGTASVPDALTDERIVSLVDELRRQNTPFDQQMETVRKLLIVAGQADLGAGLPGTQVQLSVTSFAASADGTLYMSSQRGARIWKLNSDGTLETLAGLGNAGVDEAIDDKPAKDVNLGGPVGVGFDGAGRLTFLDTTMVHMMGLGSVRYVSRAARIESDGRIGASATADRAYNVVAPGANGGAWGLVKNFVPMSGILGPGDFSVDLWALEPGVPERRVLADVTLPQGLYAAGRLDANRLLLLVEDTLGKPSAFELDTTTGTTKAVGLGAAGSATVDAKGDVFMLDVAGALSMRDAAGTTRTLASTKAPDALTSLRPACAVLMPDGSAAVAATDRKGLSLVYRVKDGAYTLVAGRDGKDLQGNALEMPLTPTGLAALPSGELYMSTEQQIMKLTPAGAIARYAGTNRSFDAQAPLGDDFVGPTGPALQANFRNPSVLHTDLAGNLYMLDGRFGQARIRRINSAGQISLVQAIDPGDGLDVGDFVVSPAGSVFVLSVDFYGNFTVTWWDAQGVLQHATKTLPEPAGIIGFGNGRAKMAWAPGDKLYITAFRSNTWESVRGITGPVPKGMLWSWTEASGFKLEKEDDQFLIPPLTVDSRGRVLLALGNRIVAYDVAKQSFSNIAGPDAAQFNGRTVDTGLGRAAQLAFDSAGNLYIADTEHGQIKRIAAADLAGP